MINLILNNNKKKQKKNVVFYNNSLKILINYKTVYSLTFFLIFN